MNLINCFAILIKWLVYFFYYLMLLYDNDICSRFSINFFVSCDLVKYQWLILNPWILNPDVLEKVCGETGEKRFEGTADLSSLGDMMEANITAKLEEHVQVCVQQLNVNSQFHIASTIFYVKDFAPPGEVVGRYLVVVLCCVVCVCACVRVCVDHAEGMGHGVGGIISNSLNV